MVHHTIKTRKGHRTVGQGSRVAAPSHVLPELRQGASEIGSRSPGTVNSDSCHMSRRPLESIPTDLFVKKKHLKLSP